MNKYLLIAVFLSHALCSAGLTPANLIILTDLDDVVLRRRNTATLFTALKNIFHAQEVRNAWKALGSPAEKHWEALYIHLIKKSNYKLAKQVRKLCTRKRLHEPTVKLMIKLAEQGFCIYTATNIGTLFFQKIKQKFPAVFNDQIIREGMTVDYFSADLIKKPDPRYFQELSKRYNPNQDKHLLFIDDRLENVEAARKAGLLAIHYKDEKQLKKDLHNYGICLCK